MEIMIRLAVATLIFILIHRLVEHYYPYKKRLHQYIITNIFYTGVFFGVQLIAHLIEQ